MGNILVVGGDGGVGSVLVRKLAERGETVVTTVLNGAQAASVRARHGDQVAIHEVDLSDADRALVQCRQIISEMGVLDAVAVCAAIAPNGPVELEPLARLRTMFEVNCIADVAIYQAAMPALRNSKGRIVFISSASGRFGSQFIGGYSASKFALEGVADVMRREAAPQGVKISLVEPGFVRTDMIMNQPAPSERIAQLSDEDGRRYGALYHGFYKLVMGALEAASTPEAVADVVIEALDAVQPDARYLAGDDAKQMVAMLGKMSDAEADEFFQGFFSEH